MPARSDALTSPRPYRPALSPEDAARLLLEEAGQGKFVQHYVETFLALVGVPALGAV